jgi:hypothetical protein
MAQPVYVPSKNTLTLEQHKKRAYQRTMKHKPAEPAPVALTQSDIKQAARGYIDNQLKLWMARVGATQDAIHQADVMYYQDIMKRKATPPILDTLLEKLIVGVAMMTLPELTGAALIFKQMMEEHELRKKAAELIAEVTKEGASEIKKSLNEFKAEEDFGNAASLGVQFFQKLYTRVGEMRNRATIANVHLTDYINRLSSDDPKLEPKLDEVLGVWCDLGLQTDDKVTISSGQLALLFLYDLMRAYCSQCVKLEMKPGIVSMSWELTGLDPAQRQAMYEAFDKIRWIDPSRPRIKKWDDLIKNWSFQRNHSWG